MRVNSNRLFFKRKMENLNLEILFQLAEEGHSYNTAFNILNVPLEPLKRLCEKEYPDVAKKFIDNGFYRKGKNFKVKRVYE